MKQCKLDVKTLQIADEFAENVIDEIKQEHIKKEVLPNKGLCIDNDYIAEQMRSYDDLVDSGILDKFYE